MINDEVYISKLQISLAVSNYSCYEFLEQKLDFTFEPNRLFVAYVK